MSMIFVVPFIQPLDLSLTELRLSPGRYVGDLILYIFLLTLLFWIVRQLGLEPVQAAIAKAGIKRRNMRIPVAAGVGLAVLIAVTVPLITNGESAERAKAIAKQQVGPGYQFHVSSIRISTSGHRSSASGVVTAWNQEEVRSIPFSWEDP